MTIYNKIVAFILTFIIIAIAIIIFSLNITTISTDDNNQEIKTSEIFDNIDILTNQYGLKKIIASNNYDLFFAQGFIHARDRLWQMDITRRKAAGKMSEIFGNRTLDADVFFRTLDLDRISKESYLQLDKKSKNILDAYSDGINYFIENHSNLFSFEFSALDYKPAKWLPYHSILISKFFSFQMSFSFWNDVTFGEIATVLSPEIALDLIPGNNYYNVKNEVIKSIEADTLNSFDTLLVANLFQIYNTAINDMSEISLISAGTKGSNSWSVYKNKQSADGGAILANDPHLPLNLPSVWYQNHIVSDSVNALGYSIPGVPLILVGRNESVSWGITNMMADICDFYIEKTDSSKDFYHINEYDTKSFEYMIDTIYVKNDKPHIYYQKRNEKSIVISNSHPFKNNNVIINYDSTSDLSFYNDYCLTFNWTGFQASNEINALYKINISKNTNEFKKGTDMWGSPPLVFNYADTAGNIALFPAGLIPKRNTECNPNLPNPGWNEKSGWSGFYSGKDFESYINSDSGYVYSANVPLDENSFFISNYWEPMSRAVRITDMIKESEYYAVRDARFMQNDILSPYAKIILDKIIALLASEVIELNNIEKEYFEALKNWDCLISATSGESSLYNTFLTKLIFNTYADELGDRLFKQYSFISSIPTRKILNDLINENKFWFDNKNTDKIEGIDFILLNTFRESVQFLTHFFKSNNLQDWKYGELHTLELKHILSENEFLKPVVTSNVYQIGGNNTTINNTEFQYYNPYSVIIGASMRFIADMESDLVLMSMPGGNSGDPVSPQYADQIRLWLNGGYLHVNFYDNSEYNEYIRFIKD